MDKETSEQLEWLVQNVGEAKNKKTTREQFELLVAEIMNNPTMGRGVPVFGSNKLKFDKFWEETTFKLNARGPPERNATEWKKVWADLKLRTKRKVSDNANSIRETGGGPFFERKLTGYEENVDNLLSIRTSAVPNGAVFGLCSAKNTPKSTTPSITEPTIQKSKYKSPTLDISTQPSTSKQALENFHSTQQYTVREAIPKSYQSSVCQSNTKESSQETMYSSSLQPPNKRRLTTQQSTTHKSANQRKTHETSAPKIKPTTIALLEETVNNQKILIDAVNTQNSILLQLVNVLQDKLK